MRELSPPCGCSRSAPSRAPLPLFSEPHQPAFRSRHLPPTHPTPDACVAQDDGRMRRESGGVGRGREWAEGRRGGRAPAGPTHNLGRGVRGRLAQAARPGRGRGHHTPVHPPRHHGEESTRSASAGRRGGRGGGAGGPRGEEAGIKGRRPPGSEEGPWLSFHRLLLRARPPPSPHTLCGAAQCVPYGRRPRRSGRCGR